jgi:hypothetical protein
MGGLVVKAFGIRTLNLALIYLAGEFFLLENLAVFCLTAPPRRRSAKRRWFQSKIVAPFYWAAIQLVKIAS